MPHHMRLGKAVQQEQRRSAAADPRKNAARSCVDPLRGETRKKVGEIRHGAFKLCLALPPVAHGYMASSKPHHQEAAEEMTCRSTSKSGLRPRQSARRRVNGCMR